MAAMTFDEWYRRIEPAIAVADVNSDGQPRYPHLIYENKFAQDVLARIEGLDFSFVHYQREIRIAGKLYRIDFTIEEPHQVPIAIEIDGTNKYDGGTRSRTTAEHGKELDREHAIQAEGFLVFHFANTQVRDRASDCRERLVGFIEQARSVGSDSKTLDELQRQLKELENRPTVSPEEHRETRKRIDALEREVRAQQQTVSEPPPDHPGPKRGRQGSILAVAAVGVALVIAIIGVVAWTNQPESTGAVACGAAEEIPITPATLASRQDEQVTLRGTVFNVVPTTNATYLNMNAANEEPRHLAFVVDGEASYLDRYEGKDIAARGVIDLGQAGQPQLRISDPTTIAECA